MPIFKNLFGGKEAIPEDRQREPAVSLLREAEAAALVDPEKAVAMLSRKGASLYDVLRIGGTMHRQFRACVEKAEARLGRCDAIPSAAVEVVCWDNWEFPKVSDLVEKARMTEAEILYFTPPPQRNPRNAMAELKALRLFAAPDTTMVTVGEEGMFFRRSFILEAGKRLPSDSEDIGQDMMDQAVALGLKVGVIVA